MNRWRSRVVKRNRGLALNAFEQATRTSDPLKPSNGIEAGLNGASCRVYKKGV